MQHVDPGLKGLRGEIVGLGEKIKNGRGSSCERRIFLVAWHGGSFLESRGKTKAISPRRCAADRRKEYRRRGGAWATLRMYQFPLRFTLTRQMSRARAGRSANNRLSAPAAAAAACSMLCAPISRPTRASLFLWLSLPRAVPRSPGNLHFSRSGVLVRPRVIPI